MSTTSAVSYSLLSLRLKIKVKFPLNVKMNKSECGIYSEQGCSDE